MTDNKGVNPVVAGVVGAAVGAAAGIAAVELAKKENREALGEKLGELKEKGEEVIEGLKDTAIGARDVVQDLSGLGDKDEADKDAADSKAHSHTA